MTIVHVMVRGDGPIGMSAWVTESFQPAAVVTFGVIAALPRLMDVAGSPEPPSRTFTWMSASGASGNVAMLASVDWLSSVRPDDDGDRQEFWWPRDIPVAATVGHRVGTGESVRVTNAVAHKSATATTAQIVESTISLHAHSLVARGATASRAQPRT